MSNTNFIISHEELKKRKRYIRKSKAYARKYVLTEEDCYPQQDNRTWYSNVDDVNDGDNFDDYRVEMFKYLNEWGYWD